MYTFYNAIRTLRSEEISHDGDVLVRLLQVTNMRNIAHHNPLDLFDIREERPHHLVCSLVVLAIYQQSRHLDPVKLRPQVIV